MTHDVYESDAALPARATLDMLSGAGIAPAAARPRPVKASAKSKVASGAAQPAPGARAVFPFSAIVGQDEMKQSLLLVAVDPSIGGVLILGDRGTGKSTAVRALAQLLPAIKAVQGCPYNSDPQHPFVGEGAERPGNARAVSLPVPVVDLPLGATEDRVVGALDLDKALAGGERAFQPGLLARANRGFLYIDEVNLLEDHLVDVLLDVAASGENVVERDGLSIRHPARFVLVGSGNPEEGELRPQLLDRFGLSVDVGTPTDVATRIEVVRRRDAFDRDPQGFAAAWAEKDEAIRRRIVAARKRLKDLDASEEALLRAAELCIALGTDGLRGELTLLRAARALAALEGAKRIEPAHVRRVAPMALRHRLRRNPLDDVRSTVRVERAIGEVYGP
jgi:magnesium chelatase subunit I